MLFFRGCLIPHLKTPKSPLEGNSHRLEAHALKSKASNKTLSPVCQKLFQKQGKRVTQQCLEDEIEVQCRKIQVGLQCLEDKIQAANFADCGTEMKTLHLYKTTTFGFYM